ncbi:hypothetical protein ACPPVQ_15165 [Diaminobutyricibacter sp. McL0618]|uniref:hypothetical protein n=1 Tax=Leifsonia sp. McL0618 TaxID=3415677 RepID=UPI003CEC45C0
MHRTQVFVGIAVGLALVLSGCSAGVPHAAASPHAADVTEPPPTDTATPLPTDPSVTVPTGSPSPSPSSSPSPSHVPSPTTAPPSLGPTVRVHATCDQVVPLSVILQDADEANEPTAYVPGIAPASFADHRAGALRCLWAGGDIYDPATATVQISVVPWVTRQVFDTYRAGLSWPETPTTIAPDSYTYCEPGGRLCAFYELTPDYGFVGYAWNLHTKPPAEVRAAAVALLQQVNKVVSSLPAPMP